MSKQQTRWQIFESADLLQAAVARIILESAHAAIADRGSFSIVLAGGTTPKQIYQCLREADTDWSRWHVYFGDERCLPVEHADRNSRMAGLSLLDHVPIPAAQIHAIPAELGAEAGAGRYAAVLAGVGEFDCVLLGMGEDAHTASLFPGQPWEGADGAPAIPVHDAPKPPSDRISLSASRLSHARRIFFLVTGAGKQDAVRLWRAGADIPVRAIAPEAGVDVYLDAAACP